MHLVPRSVGATLWRLPAPSPLLFPVRAGNSDASPLQLLSRFHSTTAHQDDENAGVLDELVNYERSGIPAEAGTTSSGRFDLGRMHRLLADLGDPHKKLQAVHVAGSKGKGSTVALLSAALTAAGYRVGAYTSPHLLALEERIALGRPGGASPRPQPIPPDDLAFLLRRHGAAIRGRAAAEGGALSHFEVVTALAFRYFADCGVDIAVLETGLGGVTDATNVLPAPNLQAAVITSLGLEHVAALGGSLRSIAAAKAGILRPGRPLVLAPQPHGEAAEVVLAAAAERGCPVTRVEQSVRVRSHGIALDPSRAVQAARERLGLELLPEAAAAVGSSRADNSSSSGGSSNGSSSGIGSDGSSSGGGPHLDLEVEVGLVGPAQHANVATAVAAARVLRAQGWHLPDGALAAGLAAAALPGRFQVVQLPGPDGPWVVLDGAHTPDSAAALVDSMRAAFLGGAPGAGAAGTAGASPGGGAAAAGVAAGSVTGGASPGSALPPIALVLAMADDKEHREVVTCLRRLGPRVAVFTRVPIAGSYQRAAAPGTLAGHWQAVAILAPPAQRPVRCRELLQASLTAAFDKARQELRGLRVQLGGGGAGGGPGPAIILITGSLHAVAEAHKMPELAPLLRD